MARKYGVGGGVGEGGGAGGTEINNVSFSLKFGGFKNKNRDLGCFSFFFINQFLNKPPSESHSCLTLRFHL